MDASLTLEPVGFFTLDALRAGWYLVWRQFVRILPVAVVAGVVGGALTGLGMVVLGVLIMVLGVVAATVWGAVLVPRLISRWTETRYGYALTEPLGVWWGITWRVVVVSLIAAVIFTPPNLVAMSLSAAYPGAPLGLVGQVLTGLLGLANFVVTIVAAGWAMSRVASAQLAGLPVAPAPSGSLPHVSPSRRATPAPIAAAGAALPAAYPAAPAASHAKGKRQCPKCGLDETERGSVIGWYCTICGWRERRG
jgi:hypothetical protein